MFDFPKLKPNSVVIVAGPTASGKSGLALDLAIELDGVVINADSMQVYKDTPILSACPSAEDKAKVPHLLYEIYESTVQGTVVDWLERAVMAIRQAWAENKIPVVVGGTGLYIDNLINGTTPIPEMDIAVREQVRQQLQEEGVNQLYEKLAKVDEVTAARLSPNDTTRVARAWEVFVQTGVPLSEWHQKPMLKRLSDAKFVVVKIMPDKKELDERCFQRFEMMIKAGALEEVRSLALHNLDANLPAMKALGVPELLAYFRGECSLEEAAANGKIHTRQYAKRQRTWFGNKLAADIILNECYKEQADIINNVKKAL